MYVFDNNVCGDCSYYFMTDFKSTFMLINDKNSNTSKYKLLVS